MSIPNATPVYGGGWKPAAHEWFCARNGWDCETTALGDVVYETEAEANEAFEAIHRRRAADLSP